MPDLAVKYLGKIRIPILDLYGVDDIEPVLKSVKERAQLPYALTPLPEPQMPIYTTILAQ
jgi:hypothetical protein